MTLINSWFTPSWHAQTLTFWSFWDYLLVIQWKPGYWAPHADRKIHCTIIQTYTPLRSWPFAWHLQLKNILFYCTVYSTFPTNFHLFLHPGNDMGIELPTLWFYVIHSCHCNLWYRTVATLPIKLTCCCHAALVFDICTLTWSYIIRLYWPWLRPVITLSYAAANMQSYLGPFNCPAGTQNATISTSLGSNVFSTP